MTISFVAVNTAVATVTTTLALVAPASVQDRDTLIAYIISHNTTSPSGFDARWQTAYNATNGATIQFSVYVLPNATKADASATFNFTVAGTTVSFGQMGVYRSSRPDQLNVALSSSANASSATVTWATATPTMVGVTLIAVFGYDLSGVTDGGISAGTNIFTNRAIVTTATGNTESLGLYDSISVATKGATGSRTMATGATAALNTGVILELWDAAGLGGGGISMPPYGIAPPRVRLYGNTATG